MERNEEKCGKIEDEKEPVRSLVRTLLKVNKKGRAENMNHALLLLLLTPPAHETAIYRQRDRERGSKLIATWKFKDNSITLRVDSWRKRGRIEGGGGRET